MEFYAAAAVRLSPLDIQRHVQVANLPHWCASIDRVISQQGERGEIYCVWGQFRVHRELIREGLRFTLPGCPNALQWTLTAPADGHGPVQVHCTISRREHDADFVASLEQFVSDWQAGLSAGLPLNGEQEHRVVAECPPWYG